MTLIVLKENLNIASIPMDLLDDDLSFDFQYQDAKRTAPEIFTENDLGDRVEIQVEPAKLVIAAKKFMKNKL